MNGATQGVAALKVEEAPKTKSRNLDVMAEYKKSGAKNGANFVVIGASRSVHEIKPPCELTKPRPRRSR